MILLKYSIYIANNNVAYGKVMFYITNYIINDNIAY